MTFAQLDKWLAEAVRFSDERWISHRDTPQTDQRERSNCTGKVEVGALKKHPTKTTKKNQQQFSEEDKKFILGRMTSAQDLLILALYGLLLELPAGCHTADTRQPRLRLSHKGRSVCQVFKGFLQCKFIDFTGCIASGLNDGPLIEYNVPVQKSCELFPCT